MRRHWLWTLLIVVPLIALAYWVGERIVSDQRFETGLAQARRDVIGGRLEVAHNWLVSLPPRHASNPDALDLLAVCEHGFGRYEAAIAAWAQIPADSPRAPVIGLARARTLVDNLGRFAEAETLLEDLLPRAGKFREEVRYTLSQIYFWEFRTEALRRLVCQSRSEWSKPALELRDLWEYDDAVVLADSAHAVLESAAQKSPQDDRVWLGLAGLDLLAGKYDDARKRLESCTKRRPEDAAVWRARLALGMGTNDLAEVKRAIAHLPSDMFRDCDVLNVRAWIAEHNGDAAAERAALEQRLTVEPAEPAILDRLSVLAFQDGQADRAAELRRKKSELDRAKDTYRRLLTDGPPTDHFVELAKLAETLNRPFEAHGWWTIAEGRDWKNPAPAEAIARLAPRLKTEPRPPGETLAARVGLTLSQSDSDESKAKPQENLASSSPIRFRDVAQAAGVNFTFVNGRSDARQLPETTSGGVALLDYDGDGKLDIYLVQAGKFPPDLSSPPTGDRLFRNKGGTPLAFEDVTEQSGIAAMPRGYGHGAAVGDYDNDGHPDLFITRWGSYALYRNKGNGTFEDVTLRLGLGGDRDWPTSAAFADFDNDGDLDLYVCHYLVWDAAKPTLCPSKPTAGEAQASNHKNDYCMPNPFPSRPDHLFRNDGGKFVDVTAEAGIVDLNGRGLGVIASDLDGDGRIDLFVANDTTANYLFHNLGNMKFEEIGLASGVACSADGAYQAGMGTAMGDLDGDGLPDLAVTNFYGESTSFYRNLGHAMFAPESTNIGLAAPTRFLLGFGISFLDADSDGLLDVIQTNGHVIDDRPNVALEMPTLLLRGTGGGKVVDVTSSAGAALSVPRMGRALAVGDLDNDGRADVVIVPQNSPVVILHNDTTTGRTLTLKLQGTTSNRDAVGAVVSVISGNKTQRFWRFGGGSFQSASDPRMHIGLGSSLRADRVEVRWPSGRVDRFENLEAGKSHLLEESMNKSAIKP